MTGAARAVRVRAHAKINLSLRILNRRDDGYHDLRTVFQALSLHDTLTFIERPGPFALEAPASPALPLDGRNLVWRAAERVWHHLERPGPPLDVLVRIEKRIPMKAGLGGGSADAAAAILGLAQVWGAKLGTKETDGLGRALGADVGFFFTGGTALGLGRGDEIYPMADLPRLGVLLVMPAFDVSTADAYRWVDEARGWDEGPKVRPSEGPKERGPAVAASDPRPTDRSLPTIPRCEWSVPANLVVNDFEPVVAARHPELGDVTRALSAAGAAAVAMSGSGSSVFGLFEELGARDRAGLALAAAGYQVERAHTLSRRDYRSSITPEATDPGPIDSTGLSRSDAVV